jgi:hypothetical protein
MDRQMNLASKQMHRWTIFFREQGIRHKNKGTSSKSTDRHTNKETHKSTERPTS